MNRARRSILFAIIMALEEIGVSGDSIEVVMERVRTIYSQIEELLEAEEEAYENYPDNLRSIDRCEQLEANIEMFYTALELLDEATEAESFGAALENIAEAKGALEEIV